jgi:hypothetical protein
VQATVKNILEPIFEADFLPVSYGFRPGKSVHGALAHLRSLLLPRIHRAKDKERLPFEWAIEGDTKGCFDNIARPSRSDVVLPGKRGAHVQPLDDAIVDGDYAVVEESGQRDFVIEQVTARSRSLHVVKHLVRLLRQSRQRPRGVYGPAAGPGTRECAGSGQAVGEGDRR